MPDKTKKHPGTILQAMVNPYSYKVATKDNSPERRYDYAQLRTAMKHLMPENARLKNEVERLRKENSILQKRLDGFRDIAAEIDLDAFKEWVAAKQRPSTIAMLRGVIEKEAELKAAEEELRAAKAFLARVQATTSS